MISQTDRDICMSPWEGPGDSPGAVAPPIFQTSLFAKPTFAEYARQQAAEHHNFVYSRGTNPTVAFLEQLLARLERGEAAKCFASGMGAISAVLGGLLRSGDHVLFVNTIYGPTLQLAEHLRRFGVEYTLLPEPTADIEDHLRENTAMVYVESPGTMMMKVLDLRVLAATARRHGIRTVIDNTWATPLLQKPIELGVDVVIHSLTKYIGGHSDVIGGAVIGSADLIEELFYRGYLLFGSVMSAMEASFVLRGLRTLPVRMEQHEANAIAVIDHLRGREEVTAIHHPYADHPADSPLVTEQLAGYSGLLSFELAEPTYDRIAGFVDALELFRIGPSWGGYESLVTSPIRPTSTPEPPASLIRLSVGLEGAQRQIEDLDHAFAAIR
ncbi:trans-sulfuration enzyme family protein [Georgenia deserti]|uniref:Trans-sulfuration enzyme family protein n=1 Tax=Georgenia deserti TaxID=2093781 RepID=A0ABW4L866_9MICO